jgi:hypothetical protein
MTLFRAAVAGLLDARSHNGAVTQNIDEAAGTGKIEFSPKGHAEET